MLVMYELKKIYILERYLREKLLGPGPRFIKKNNLPGRGFTKVEKHWHEGPSNLRYAIALDALLPSKRAACAQQI
jgi:hypothetical protein